MNKFVTIEVFGKVEVHLPSTNGNYATLCGLDGDDPNYAVQQSVKKTSKNARVTCQDCYEMWKLAQSYSRKDFTPSNIA